MDRKKQKRLEKAGWKVGSASTFLNLTNAEEKLVEMKLSLGTRLRKARQRHNLTQTALANRMGSSQSRVAKMEAGDPSVSLDLLIRSLISLGASERELSRIIVTPRAA